ncbi:unnamed protein product [Cylicocyclus nassatus]|uniref:Uncharacterized protein n=1 Tax=Cylicocyclus nassatus TaxID=53992 RepID=A0AA36GP21_CYLNA|nr:unnamed protein product [Cylicocyclus nassatus]
MSDDKDHKELKQELQQLTEVLHTFSNAINTLRNACEETLNNLSKSVERANSERTDSQNMEKQERSPNRRDSEETETIRWEHYKYHDQEVPNKMPRLRKEHTNTQRAMKRVHTEKIPPTVRKRRIRMRCHSTSGVGGHGTTCYARGTTRREVIEVFNEVNEIRELHDEDEERFVEVMDEEDEEQGGWNQAKNQNRASRCGVEAMQRLLC